MVPSWTACTGVPRAIKMSTASCGWPGRPSANPPLNDSTLTPSIGTRNDVDADGVAAADGGGVAATAAGGSTSDFTCTLGFGAAPMTGFEPGAARSVWLKPDTTLRDVASLRDV